ncbi:two-component system response regulator YesN [Paenibacillus endophyticus]|uniref:Two-component system response regulator YesN n=1 Tax=Paenibacillus endophyticus TaxID=1294268 RepID=A0A7W5C7S9_9BACL|nr:response regulator [Paenibacillus endophyticus]MBB3152716.1 two-component system response regulator YesN [Paenibacillus endophyticus]
MDVSETIYKVILADDEPLILRSLKAAIPWKELRLDIAGEARNGEEALRLVLQHDPHLVISDIRMPALDGISLMKEAMAYNPNLIFIVISGYGEFQYAREGLRLGAFDYLLKPIDHDELTQMIEKAVAKLDIDKMRKLETDKLLHSVQALSLLARERMFAELIEGNQRPLQHLQWLEQSELEQPYIMVVVQLDHYSAMDKHWTAEEKRLWFFAIRNILEEWSKKNDGLAVFPFHSGEWILLFSDTTVQQKKLLGEDIIYHIKRYSKLTCSVGISKQAQGVDQLSAAYQSANQALFGRFYAGAEGIFMDEEESKPAPGAFEYPKRLEQQMLACVRTLNLPRMAELFDELKVTFVKGAFSKEITERILAAMTVALHRQFEHLNLTRTGSIEDLLQNLQEAATLEELMSSSKAAVLHWIKQNQASQAREDGMTLIEKAKKYIENHYHNDLGMDEVSEYVDLSTSHFCTLFKQVSGYTFLEYLTQQRMEKAKYILRHTDVKVYQVAPLVGYHDPRYFTQVFKKITGQTPSEYRDGQETA